MSETVNMSEGVETGATNGPKKMKMDPKEELAEFDEVFDTLKKDCLFEGGILDDQEIGEAMKHFLGACDHNVQHGKKNRGIFLVTSVRHLVDDPSEDVLFKARVLGWCIEWLQAAFLVADDIMDHSSTRRRRPCWYKVEGVEMIAINDTFYLEAAVYKILKKYFRSEPYYVDLMELFHETTLQTLTGQGMDLLATNGEKMDFSKFDMAKYDAIAKWKTAFYSFYLPVALAMVMTGRKLEGPANDNAKAILLEMGHFFQVQDDVLDCFGDPEVTGKVGTDIQDNKCGWLINQALLLCTEEQRQRLEENYAKKDDSSVEEVKKVFVELDLESVFRKYEEESYQRLRDKIDSLSASDLPKEIFFAIAQKIFKRKK